MKIDPPFEANNFRTDQGSVSIRRWQLEGVQVAHAHSRFQQPGRFSWQDDRDIVHLHFALKGACSFKAERIGQTDVLQAGHHNLLYAPFGDMVVHHYDTAIETFGIQLHRDRFVQLTESASDSIRRFADGILEGKAGLLRPKWGNWDGALRQAIQSVIDNPFSGNLQRQWIWFKTIEILVLQAEALGAEDPVRVEGWSPKEQKQLDEVRELLRSRFNDPPTLPEIARAVGLNEYKLKRGFKARFGTSIFKYLTALRLEKARQLLLDSQVAVKDIAVELGYSSPQHLATAFRKQFEQSPRDYRKAKG